MNIPQIPTDSLYKFMALSGLIIAFLCSFLPLKQIRDINLEIIDITEQRRLLNEKNDFLNIRKDIDKKLVSGSAEEAAKIFRERQLLILEAVKITAKMERVIFLQNEIKRIKLIAYFTAGFGAFLAILGFILWYVRVQRYMDKRLKENYTQQVNSGDG